MGDFRIKRESFETIHSTNSYLKELNGGDADYDMELVTTEYQTAGRGQKGNSWESENGKNLLFSLLFHPRDIGANRQFCISEIISLSVVNALKQVSEGVVDASDFSVKWPNDIYWKEKKIAGILIENDLVGHNIKDCIIGVGLNVNQSCFVSDAPNPVSLYNIVGTQIDRESLLSTIMTNFIAYIERLYLNNISDIHREYMSNLFRRSGIHHYRDVNGLFQASIKDVRDDGRLILLDTDGNQRIYEFKEVSIVLN